MLFLTSRVAGSLKSNHTTAPLYYQKKKNAVISCMELTQTEVVVAVVVVLIAAAPLLHNVWLAFLTLCWTPLRIKRAFQAQGIPTLPFRFFYGNLPEMVAMKHAARSHAMPQNSHDIAPRLLPHHYFWARKYSVPYVYWFRSQARYNVVDAEDAKDILSTKFGHYIKAHERSDSKDLVGNGILSLQGEGWAHRRRILNPAFFLDRLKAMIPTMEACTITMMENWASLIDAGQAVDVQQSLKDLTADIIAHTAFGSSFAEGRIVFELQREQQFLVVKRRNSPYVPGASNPEWQTRTREEVIAVCGMIDTPTAQSINHLKIMCMVLNETLRLYPPLVRIIRQAGSDIQLGKVVVPKGTVLMLPVVSLMMKGTGALMQASFSPKGLVKELQRLAEYQELSCHFRWGLVFA